MFKMQIPGHLLALSPWVWSGLESRTLTGAHGILGNRVVNPKALGARWTGAESGSYHSRILSSGSLVCNEIRPRPDLAGCWGMGVWRLGSETQEWEGSLRAPSPSLCALCSLLSPEPFILICRMGFCS